MLEKVIVINIGSKNRTVERFPEGVSQPPGGRGVLVLDGSVVRAATGFISLPLSSVHRQTRSENPPHSVLPAGGYYRVGYSLVGPWHSEEYRDGARSGEDCEEPKDQTPAHTSDSHMLSDQAKKLPGNRIRPDTRRSKGGFGDSQWVQRMVQERRTAGPSREPWGPMSRRAERYDGHVGRMPTTRMVEGRNRSGCKGQTGTGKLDAGRKPQAAAAPISRRYGCGFDGLTGPHRRRPNI